jgi:hypothetical protein
MTDTITSNVYSTVTLANGGSYGNPLTIGPSATVTAVNAIYAQDSWTIQNYGTLSASLSNGIGVDLNDGGSVTNASDGTISGNFGIEANPAGAAITVDNFGGIYGQTAGIYLGNGGSVTNESTGTIGGIGYGVSIRNSTGTVDNFGLIEGTGTHGIGVYLGAGGTVTNEIGGTISGVFDGVFAAAPGTVTNDGLITGTGAGGVGVELGDGSTLVNSGTASGGFAGVYLDVAGSITNLSGGTITGDMAGILAKQGAATIDNAGTIIVTLSGDNAANLYQGGNIINEVGGTISASHLGIFAGPLGATTIDNSGLISGSAYGGVFLLGGGSVTNEATGAISGYYFGVVAAGPSASLGNAGTITTSATMGTGVDLSSNSDTLINSGTITGTYLGAAFNGKYATLENSGTITGMSGNAVLLNAYGTNRLIIDAGAVFNGTVEALTSAANTIELTSGASVGTISGVGTQYQNFQTVTIDNHAAWAVGGTTAALEGVTIDGFNSHDRLDLSDLTYNSGGTATVNGSDLIIDGSITIQMDGGITSDTFQLLSDGGSGTFVEESDYTPCYCRGTRIRTAKGEVAVESLRIGDLVVTADGAVLPIKWIGRRDYRDWLAVGNAEVQPILFKAGSIADDVPTRDLYVSPEHAMFLNGMLVPALHLVNGGSVVKVERMEEIEYFHLEFDRHVVIFAEGAAAESFVDDDSRMLFHNADEYRRLYPDEPRGRFTEFCAPRVEADAALDVLHRTLATRAARLLPNGTAAQSSPRLGYLDRATRSTIEGWAFAGAGEGPVRLAILVNGAVVGQTVADRYRADLEAAGIGNGRHAFRFALPHGLSPDIAHRIEVRREDDWSVLKGAPAMLEAGHGPRAMPPH